MEVFLLSLKAFHVTDAYCAGTGGDVLILEEAAYCDEGFFYETASLLLCIVTFTCYYFTYLLILVLSTGRPYSLHRLGLVRGHLDVDLRNQLLCGELYEPK